MRTRRQAILSAVAAFGVAGMAQAAMTVDGVLDAGYGAPLNVGQNSSSVVGSSIYSTYAKIDSGTLYFFFGGNLQPGGPRLNVLIDDGTSGMGSKLLNLPGNPGHFNRLAQGEDSIHAGWGLQFDTAFSAGHYLSMSIANQSDGYMDYGNLTTLYTGSTGHMTHPVDSPWQWNTGFSPDAPAMTGGYDNSNAIGFGDAATLAGITTGVEFGIPLTSLSASATEFKIAAFLTNGSNDTMYNQLVGLPAGYSANLGDPAWAVNMTSIAGDQFVSVAVPEPASAGMIALGMLALAAKRRRSR